MKADRRLRLAVLISGTGSNLKALIDARDSGRLAIDIVQVISNRVTAPGLDHARAAGIPVAVIDRANAGPQGEDHAVAERLRGLSPDLVLLSGYMRIVGAPLIEAFDGRMINQHPSLLPKYKGLDTYQRVLEAGDPEHGASVHFVTAQLDGGPVIAQLRVPVRTHDTPASLAACLGPLEHQLLVAVVELFAARRVEMRDGKACLDGQALAQALQWHEGRLHA
jgi:phosphoribosylglycinamide formyltransferase-1